MSVTIELDEESAAVFDVIRGRAAAVGMPLDRYLQTLTSTDATPVDVERRSPRGPLSEAEMDKWLSDLASTPPAAPSLPENFSRADIYFDHD